MQSVRHVAGLFVQSVKPGLKFKLHGNFSDVQQSLRCRCNYISSRHIAKLPREINLEPSPGSLGKKTFLHLPMCDQKYSTSLAHSPHPSLWVKLKYKMGLKGKMRYSKTKLIYSGYRLYFCCLMIPDYVQLFKDLQLPDTFYSWYLLVELHVWLCMVRLRQMGREGKYVQYYLVSALWQDVKIKGKHLAQQSGFDQQKQLSLLGEHLNAALIGYDEGVLSHDRVLAGALWRLLFNMEGEDPVKLAFMVNYIRKQVKYLDEQEEGLVLSDGLISFLPLYGDKDDRERNKEIFKKILTLEIIRR